MRVLNTDGLHTKFLSVALAFVLAFGTVLTCVPLESAHSETTETEFDADANQQIIEQSAQKYEEASAKAQQLQQECDENQQRIDEINAELPSRVTRANAAVKTLFFLDGSIGGIINMIFGTEDLTTALMNFNYVEHIREKNANDVMTFSSMKTELEELQSGLSAKKAEAESQAAAAQTALQEAQALREEAQRKAQEQAEKERAEAEAAAKAAEEAKNDASSSDSSSSSDSTSGPSNDDADWSQDKTTFVNEWATRIDNYLSGSPLAGQGKTFAEAAWDYGVDPRWSPAISNTESSKGRYCFASHNAWGWGSYSWDSWEEAIRTHVRGLKNGYGYTISVTAAKKYCPPNWEHWYNATSAQMDMI